MDATTYTELLAEIKSNMARLPSSTFAIVGHTATSYDLIAFFRSINAESRLLGIYSDDCHAAESVKPLASLADDRPDVAIIASDDLKESLLEAAAPHLLPKTDIVIGGYGHWAFRNTYYERTLSEVLVPSLANGYPHTLVHLFQCLENAARLQLEGVVAEFGMYKGGTTMALAEFITRLGQSWKVIGFDTFDGFPPRRNVLDMYAHPGCVFHNEATVRAYFLNHNVEIVAGDIVKTASRLTTENVILAFIDTDNYTPASAILRVIQDRIVPGGAIVFDHFTGRNRFKYTLGERIAAKVLLSDKRYFHLHDTGVFFRQM